ncbi:MAG: TetR/AcrR family transcriptional regulator [Oscillospiraceae bacterium]|jgi:AcrR family transcriptional regulator|nr:TetR/AcrR family transcriptional regulator [Oscillospiraceae bacterium]
MDGFERRRERKKENIRQAAFELFSAHGVQKVSIAEIASRAGVSQVTIYNYFVSKDGLLRDVISWLLDKRLKQDTEIVESDMPFPQKIGIFITERTDELSGLNPGFIKSMMSEDPVIRQITEDFTRNRYIPLMLRLIEKGKQEGCINNSISNQTILLYINIFREGKHSDVFPGILQSPHMLKELVTLFFYGIMGGPLGE